MTALEIAIAKIEADGIAFAQRKARIEADARIRRITSEIVANADQITGYGYEGFLQVVAGLDSSRRARKARAEMLLSARTAQIDGRGRYAKIMLGKASRARIVEMRRRFVEISASNLARVDAALAVAAE